MSEDRIRVHIKNTRWSTPEARDVFTITSARFAAAAERHADLARKLDVFVDYDVDQFDESMKKAEILIAWDLPTEDLAERAPRLRMIHIIGAGVEHLCPMDWLPPAVVLVNNKGAHAEKAGEYGLMSVLMLHSHLPAIFTNQIRSQWKSLFSTPIAGRTLLIVGVGSIGGAVARRVKPLGVRVLGVSRHGHPVEGVDEMFTTDKLDAVLPEADFVFVAVPLTTETRGLFDRRRLSLIKRGSGIVNVGRAGLMDYDALVKLLRTGDLGGAILDVFDPEPLPSDSPLWRTPNLLITPHVSADDADSYVEMTLDLFFDNVRRYLAGQPLRNVVRPDLEY
jgi:phosphoglycerate dehydrogenase-like enzyme